MYNSLIDKYVTIHNIVYTLHDYIKYGKAPEKQKLNNQIRLRLPSMRYLDLGVVFQQRIHTVRYKIMELFYCLCKDCSLFSNNKRKYKRTPIVPSAKNNTVYPITLPYLSLDSVLFLRQE